MLIIFLDGTGVQCISTGMDLQSADHPQFHAYFSHNNILPGLWHWDEQCFITVLLHQLLALCLQHLAMKTTLLISKFCLFAGDYAACLRAITFGRKTSHWFTAIQQMTKLHGQSTWYVISHPSLYIWKIAVVRRVRTRWVCFWLNPQTETRSQACDKEATSYHFVGRCPVNVLTRNSCRWNPPYATREGANIKSFMTFKSP